MNLPKNSVGAKQIKANAVTTTKIKIVLPAGFRPTAGSIMVVNVLCGGGSGECENTGDEQRYVKLVVAGSNAEIEGAPVDGRVLARPGVIISLDGVTFRAES